jgi:hypothetical protein
MKITFKDQPCKLICRIYVEDVFAGEVHKDIFSSKWTIKPDFEANTNYYSELRYEYFSSYEAGKALAEAYSKKKSRKRNILRDDFDLDVFSLDDVLSFLKFEK